MYVRVMVFSANFQKIFQLYRGGQFYWWRKPKCQRIFADDSLLYRHIKTNEDTTSLQDDHNNLQDWERDWQMHINPDKCEVIRITTKRKIIPSSYFIHGKELNIKSKGKYLGITISQNLS
jgi:hypothetical protein